MDPLIGVSITRVNSHRWIFGSSIICERVEDSRLKPTNEIVHWQDGDSTFYLRKNTESLALAGDSEIDRIHLAGTSAAVWSIGDIAICKVHGWCEGLELEADTIRFVRQYAGEVPVPEVVYTWIDHELNRTFLITKRVSGETLDQAWPRLDKIKRERIADENCTVLHYTCHENVTIVSNGDRMWSLRTSIVGTRSKIPSVMDSKNRWTFFVKCPCGSHEKRVY